MPNPKILIILGPTASGKSALAVRLAKKFRGEVVSADSRQVYKGLDIGSGKITHAEMQGIPHHLLDVSSPKNVFTVEDFKEKANQAIQDILQREKLPIICGGSGFYIQAVVDNISFPNVMPNKKLRSKLEKLSALNLLKKLMKLDPRRAKEIDPHNKRRIIRAIEIATSLGKVPKIKAVSNEQKYKSLILGLKASPEILRKRIHDRLLDRMKMGMLGEAKKLRLSGLSLKRMENLGLEYRYLARHLLGKLSKSEMLTELEGEIWKFSRRQMTWFKKDKRIKWFDINNASSSKNLFKNTEKTIEKFLH